MSHLHHPETQSCYTKYAKALLYDDTESQGVVAREAYPTDTTSRRDKKETLFVRRRAR